MKWNPRTRRHFLQGAGRAALTLPVLSSLLPRKAEAQVTGTPSQKNFIGIPIFNHLAMSYNLNETEGKTTAPEFMPQFINMKPYQVPGRQMIYSKALADVIKDSPNGRVSGIIDSSFNTMLPKMTFLGGIDYIFEAHHGGHFGNAWSVA